MNKLPGMVSAYAGQLPPLEWLVDVSKLITAYYTEMPDPSIIRQRVAFGTSGHRGSSFDATFNEAHILAITQAICLFRTRNNITGPLFLGMDTHAISVPAFASALEVLAANGVEVMISDQEEYTPTPVISHAILTYNQNRSVGLADGIVITPSHNPPQYGGFKYNPPNGGPADVNITNWIEKKANFFIEQKLQGIKRMVYNAALKAPTTHRYDYLNRYVNDLENVIDMNIIRDSNIHVGVNPLGGAGVHYWQPIAERYKLNLTIVQSLIDPTFRFIPLDKDGQIRMDPSSPYVMAELINIKNNFDIAFACDTDHDRHGIVSPKYGLLSPNHYISIAAHYLFQHRPLWDIAKGVGKSIVTSQMLNNIINQLQRPIYEFPVGFKWFVPGLLDGTLGFCGEESAGASLSRLNGAVWSTDKDGMVPGLLAAEITARTERDLGDIYNDFEQQFGATYYQLDNAPATFTEQKILKNLLPQQITTTHLAGEIIETILTTAPGNNEPIGGLKVITKAGWFAIRPSGTEPIYKIYAESLQSTAHLQRILMEAKQIVQQALQTQG